MAITSTWGPHFISMVEGVLQQIGPYLHAALRAGIKPKRNANTRLSTHPDARFISAKFRAS
jgi:hypothetical protein